MSLSQSRRLRHGLPWLLLGLGILLFPWQLPVNRDGLPQALEFVRASLSPDLSPEFLSLIVRATGVTFAFAVCGTVLSLAIGFLGGILSSEVWWQASSFGRLRYAVRAGLSAFRAIHELVWGLIFVNLFGLDPIVGVIAIALPFGAIVAKVFSEILDETPRDGFYALVTAGVPPPAAMLYGLLPQALPNLISYGFYRFECALRSSAVLGIIGAGGLGYEIFLSLQSLRYEQLWTAFYALIILTGLVDSTSARLRQKLGLTSRLQLKGQTAAPSRRAMGVLVLAAASIGLLCFWAIQADWSLLWSDRTRQLLMQLLADARPSLPSFSQSLTLAWLAWQTLVMSVLASVLASGGGLLLSFPAAQGFLQPGGLLRSAATGGHSAIGYLGYWTARLLLLVSRAIPAPIWALVFLYVIFPGIWPGVFALALHNLGILGRLLAEVNENSDCRPVVALKAQGAMPMQAILYGLLPQNLPKFLAYSLYRWEVCLRATVVVGLVGAGGLGRQMTEQISNFDYGGLTLTLGVFMALTYLIDTVSGSLRRQLR